MYWKGRKLETYGDLMEFGIDKCDSPEEAKEFKKLYSQDNTYADENIGYMAGYYSRAEADKIFLWFDVEHPIFGRKHPSPEEAFQMGQDMAAGRKNLPFKDSLRSRVTDKFD